MPINVGDILRKRQQVQRLPPLLMVLMKHGFGHLIHHLNLQSFLPSRFRLGVSVTEQAKVESIPMPRRLRMVLEEWGPTAVKLGQLLSTRPDLVPESYLLELRKLTDSVQPFDSEKAKEIIVQELGKPMEELFRHFDDTPIAAGSIGQAHRAILKTGERVVVKVKRPDIDRVMMVDLDLIEALAVPFLEWIEDLNPLQPAMLVNEFRRSILRELDFVAEAAVTQKIGDSLSDVETVYVPKVYWDMTRSKVLTVERLRGVSVYDDEGLARLEIGRDQLARNLADAFLTQIFKVGLFHADPHGGNLLVMKDGRIGLIDFGMTGRLDRELRGTLGTTFIALTRGDLEMITECYTDIGVLSFETDQSALRDDLASVLDKYYGIPVRCLDMNRCVADTMAVARRHKIQLPRDFVMVGKSFGTMVMIANQLDPDFNLAEVAKPFARSLLAYRFSPKRMGQDTLAGLWSVSQSLRRLPRDMRTFSRKLVAGRLRFQVQHDVKAFEGFARETGPRHQPAGVQRDCKRRGHWLGAHPTRARSSVHGRHSASQPRHSLHQLYAQNFGSRPRWIPLRGRSRFVARLGDLAAWPTLIRVAYSPSRKGY